MLVLWVYVRVGQILHKMESKQGADDGEKIAVNRAARDKLQVMKGCDSCLHGSPLPVRFSYIHGERRF